MMLGTSIRLVKLATLVGVLLMGVGFYVMSRAFATDNMIWGMCIVLLSSLFLFGRKFWVRVMLRRAKYPGLLWGVCDSIGLLGGLDLDDPAIMDDLYKPGYSTEEVLHDNHLSSVIYPATTVRGKMGSYGYIAAGAAAFGGWRMNNQYTTYCYVASALLIVITVMVSARQGANADLSKPPAYEFTPQGLLNQGTLIPWREIESWKQGTDGTGSLGLHIKTFGSVTDSRAGFLPVTNMSVTMTDLYILLLHYKYKYEHAASA